MLSKVYLHNYWYLSSTSIEGKEEEHRCCRKRNWSHLGISDFYLWKVVGGLFSILGLVIFTFDNGSKRPNFSIICGYCVTSTKFLYCWFCCDCWMLLIINCCYCCGWFHLRREVEVGGGLGVVVNCDFSFRQILFKQWVWQKLENDFLWFFFDKQRVGQRIGNDFLWFFLFLETNICSESDEG